MEQRYRIGIVARFSAQWAAGRYYVENLIKALGGARQSIEITVLHDGEAPAFPAEITDSIALKFRQLEPAYSFSERLQNKASRIVSGKNLVEKRVQDNEFDVVLPLGRWAEYPFALISNMVFWIPDFQEKHYPENFSAEELQNRERERDAIAMNAPHLMLSSQAAASDLRSFYPHHRCQVHIQSFAVFNTINQTESEQELILREFGVSKHRYFVCANQFWKHKNHRVLIEAVAQMLKAEPPHPEFKLLMSGKESGFRNDGIAAEMKSLVSELGLEDRISFLGFADRQKLLVLMKNAASLLQPSFFEGWNTSIEDAKSLDVPVLASDIPVHQEQLTDTSSLVTANDPEAWAAKMLERLASYQKVEFNYAGHQTAFAESLLKMVDELQKTRT